MNTLSHTGTNGDSPWLAEALRLANIGNWQWDVKADLISWSEELYRIYGLDPLSFPASFKAYIDMVHPEDRESVKKTIDEVLKTKNKATFEKRIVRPDKQVRYLKSWAAVRTNETGDSVIMYGSVIDITDAKLNELELKKKEKEFETILERITDAFVAMDENWIYTYVNKNAGEILGKEPSQLVGKHIWTEFPEGKGQPFYKACYAAMETQKYQHINSFYAPFNKWFVNHIYPSPDGLTIYFEDITAQKELEASLNNYKEELEKKVKERTTELEEQNAIINKQKEEIEDIIKELHHRVKNNMQIISSLLNLQSNMVDDPKVKSMLSDCQNRVHSMALIHEKMYQSNSLTKVNAKDYLPVLIEDIINSSSLSRKIDLDFRIDPIQFGTKMMVPIGLLVNEIVLNSIKHAFHSMEKGKIIFEFHKLENGRYRMVIGDNGSGINQKASKHTGLGSEIIEAFVGQLEGTIKLLEGPGTVYEIEFGPQ